jgi:hypothetical protein
MNNHESAPGLDCQTWDYAYDARPTIMALLATCAIGEVSRIPSRCSAEQFDNLSHKRESPGCTKLSLTSAL